jgi:scyllo-inositol 2-dehydrogenase (NADP+)
MLNVGIASFGHSGQVFHAPLICCEPRLRWKALVKRNSSQNPDPNDLAEYAEYIQRNGPIQLYSSYVEMLQDESLDVICVNTPHSLHFSMCRQALERGKNVVVEKPFVVNIDQGQELIELAKSTGKTLAVFHNKRLDSDMLTVQKAMKDQRLGELVEVEWHYDRYRTGVTHKVWKESPHQEAAGTWWDLGIHLVDAALHIFGKPDCVAYADLASLRGDVSTDFFDVVLRYPSGMRLRLHSSTFVKKKGPTVIMHGKRGTFIKYGSDVQEDQLKRNIWPTSEDYGIDPAKFNITWTSGSTDGTISEEEYPVERGAYQQFYQNVVDVILQSGDLHFKPSEALDAVKVILLAEEAHKKHSSIMM